MVSVCLQRKCRAGTSLGMDYIDQSLAQRLVLISLSPTPPLMDHRSFDLTHSPVRSFVVPLDPFSLYVTPSAPLLKHLHVAINKLKNGDLLDLDEFKLFWRVLIQLTTSLFRRK